MILRQIFMMILTVLIFGIAIIISIKIFVGLIKLLVVGAAIGIGAIIAIFLIYKMRRLVTGNHNYPQR